MMRIFMICAATKYYSGDQIETIEMGGVCGTYGRVVYRVGGGGGPEGKRLLGSPRRKWEQNIEINLYVIESGRGLDCCVSR